MRPCNPPYASGPRSGTLWDAEPAGPATGRVQVSHVRELLDAGEGLRLPRLCGKRIWGGCANRAHVP
jgi:hypothetical protein